MTIRPFTDSDLDGAAALLAERHQRHQEVEPLLPTARDFRAQVEHDWGREGASGAVVLTDDEIVGYLFGAPREEAVWGANVWVEFAGHAVQDAEVARDLYAAAAEVWVAEGRTRHYALVPASHDRLVDAWFRVGFGAQHAMGIREVSEPAALRPPAGVTIRSGRSEDVEAAEALGSALNRHQSLSPVFSSFGVEDPESYREEWLEEVADPEAAVLVAERDGRLVSLFTVAPVEYSTTHTGLSRPERACILGYAATLPDERGTGVGVALTEAAHAWARERGYPTIVTDWRVTNLLSSRFWPRRGFRTTFLRLYRSIP
jgi:GNAT superfamily N-acetyltransferase